MLTGFVLGGFIAPGLCQTNQEAISSTQIEKTAVKTNINKIGITYNMGFNFKVDFRNLGGLQLSDPGPSTGSAVNRNYDNGYNRVDSSGNQGGLTWNWGYTSPNSAQPGSLTLQSDATPATAKSGTYQEGVEHGGEIFYAREMIRREKWRGGLQAAFGYTAISIKDEETLSYYINRTSDRFDIGSVVLPLPPYRGSFQGPGPLISSDLTPSQRSTTVLQGAATIYGSREMHTDLFSLRLGPYFEIPLHPKWSILIDGGLFLAFANSRFKYQETVTISDPAYGINLTSAARSDLHSETEFLVGGYAGASISYAISEKVGVFVGARFQSAGQAVNKTDGKKSILDLGNSIIASVGASYSF